MCMDPASYWARNSKRSEIALLVSTVQNDYYVYSDSETTKRFHNQLFLLGVPGVYWDDLPLTIMQCL